MRYSIFVALLLSVVCHGGTRMLYHAVVPYKNGICASGYQVTGNYCMVGDESRPILETEAPVMQCYYPDKPYYRQPLQRGYIELRNVGGSLYGLGAEGAWELDTSQYQMWVDGPARLLLTDSGVVRDWTASGDVVILGDSAAQSSDGRLGPVGYWVVNEFSFWNRNYPKGLVLIGDSLRLQGQAVPTPPGIDTLQVHAIERSDSRIWVGTNQGLFVYAQGAWTWLSQKDSSLGLARVHWLEMVDDTTMYAFSYAPRHDGVCSGALDVISGYPVRSTQLISAASVSAMTCLGDGSCAIANSSAISFRGKLASVPSDARYVFDLAFDSLGNLWAATNFGVYAIDTATMAMSYLNSDGVLDRLPSAIGSEMVKKNKISIQQEQNHLMIFGLHSRTMATLVSLQGRVLWRGEVDLHGVLALPRIASVLLLRLEGPQEMLFKIAPTL